MHILRAYLKIVLLLLKKLQAIQYMNLGDTRHLALINLIAEGATPMIAMELAGHDNPVMSAHYFSNITNWIECKTYHQYKRLIKGKQEYTISQYVPTLEVGKIYTAG